MRNFISGLKLKNVVDLKILKTDAKYRKATEPVASQNNYLNSYFHESKFLGLGKKQFDGNSVALQNLMTNHISNL